MAGSRRSAKLRMRARRRHAESAENRLVHEQLDLKRRQIRILRLLPSRSYKNPVRCLLHTAYLDDKPSYEALSYAWGDTRACESVSVNGASFLITTSLMLALRRLRGRIHPRDIWVDAICIDQSNDAEKSHQVNLMRDIYSATTEAILWLGDYVDSPVTEISAALHGLRQLNSENNLAKNRVSSVNSRSKVTRRIAAQAFDLLRKMSLNEHYSPRDESTDTKLASDAPSALSAIVLLPWWTRVWTVQEAILPKHATFVYGSMRSPMETFMKAFSNSIGHHRSHCCSYDERFYQFWEIMHTISFIKNSTFDINIFTYALQTLKWRQASDPKDHVFALLGLGGLQVINADYSLSKEAVFIRSTRNLILFSEDLLPLLRTAEGHRSSGLPTWVPDWSADLNLRCIHGDSNWYMSYGYFNAARGTKAEIGSTEAESVLDLRALAVDRIQQILDVRDWKSTIRHFSSMAGKYPAGGTYEDALWAVLTTDINNWDNKGIRRASMKSKAEYRKERSEGVGGLPLNLFFRRLLITEKGMLGSACRDIKIGDVVYILYGGRMPFILRPHGSEDSNQREYIGQAYVHGIMDGEALEGDPEPEWISLV